jgi:ABC-type polysaccharide/polyol phosphate export permease
MLTAAMLMRDHNPLRLFGLVALLLFLCVGVLLVLALLSVQEGAQLYNQALLVGIFLFAILSAFSFGLGLVLNAVNTRFRQLKQLLRRNR